MTAKSRATALAALLLLAHQVVGLSGHDSSHHKRPRRGVNQCQATNASVPEKSSDPLFGCPHGTLFVSQTDSRAHFSDIQSAVLSLPKDNTQAYILIGAGEYHGTVNVTRKGPTTLYGQSDAPHDVLKNLVTVWNASRIDQSAQSPGQDDADTAILTVAPDYNAARVGSGFTGYDNYTFPSQSIGCADFRAYSINFSNRGTTYTNGPSLALDVSHANAGFYACSFQSYQDTLYVGHQGKAYFKNSEVLGQTDYIFGYGTAWFQSSTIGSRGSGGGITAWKGTVPSKSNTYGAYFDDCRVVRARDANPTAKLDHNCALGRPWNNQSRVIYLNTYMDETVRRDGFIAWSAADPRIPPKGNWAEYNSSGPGFDASARNLTLQVLLTAQEAAKYTPASVFGDISWIDPTY